MMKPWCWCVQPWIVRLEAGRLDLLRARLLASHLGNCPTCRDAWEQQLALRTELQVGAAPVPVDFDRLWAGVEPRLQSTPMLPSRRSSRPFGTWVIGGAVAAVAIVWFQQGRNLVATMPTDTAVLPKPAASGSAVLPRDRESRREAPPLQVALNSPPKESPVPVVPDQDRQSSRPSASTRISAATAGTQNPMLKRAEASVTVPPPAQAVQRRIPRGVASAAPVEDPSVPDDASAWKTASWSDNPTSELSPMEAVQQASLSRSLFH